MLRLAMILIILTTIPFTVSANPLVEDLRATYTEEGIIASTGHFNDLWARDAMFASWGSLQIGDTEQVNASLHTLLHHEKDGIIPLRVGRGFQVLKFIGINTRWPERVKYTTDKSFAPPADSNCLFLVTLERYVSHTGDDSALKDWNRIEQVHRWMKRQDTDRNGLMEQGNYADWADSLERKGESLYVNACYAAAQQAMAQLASYSGKNRTAYDIGASTTISRLDKFWNGEYYTEFVGSDVIDTAGNLLMVEWTLTPYPRDVVATIGKRMVRDTFLVTMTPRHSLNDKSSVIVLAQMGDYHEDQRWSWISGLYLSVTRRYDGERHHQFRKLWQERIAADNGVYEVYEPDGSPVSRLFYRSQKPFAWGSGMMLYGLNR